MTEEQEKPKQPEDLEARGEPKEQKPKNTLADMADYIEFDVEDLRKPGRETQPGGRNEGHLKSRERAMPILRQLSESGMQSLDEARKWLADEAFKLEGVADLRPNPNKDKFFDLMHARNYLEVMKNADLERFRPDFHQWRQQKREEQDKIIAAASEERAETERQEALRQAEEIRRQLKIKKPKEEK